MLTPCKQVKGKRKSSFREKNSKRPVLDNCFKNKESFFNRLNEKIYIQKASKVRATKGLPMHIFGKLAIALLVSANL